MVNTKKLTLRLTEEEYQLLEKITGVTGKSQNQVFKELLATLKGAVEQVQPVTVLELQRKALKSD